MKYLAKILTFTSLLIILNQIAFCQPPMEVPFIGTRSFNFVGGTGTEQSITIDLKGNCKVYFIPCCGLPIKKPVYNKKFTNPLKLIYKDYLGKTVVEYYKIEGEFIYLLDEKRNIKLGCKEEEEPCFCKLYYN